MTGTYHAPHFEPTVDELETLKQLETGKPTTPLRAHNGHMSKRLIELGFITQGADGDLTITDTGRHLIRRQNN